MWQLHGLATFSFGILGPKCINRGTSKKRTKAIYFSSPESPEKVGWQAFWDVFSISSGHFLDKSINCLNLWSGFPPVKRSLTWDWKPRFSRPNRHDYVAFPSIAMANESPPESEFEAAWLHYIVLVSILNTSQYILFPCWYLLITADRWSWDEPFAQRLFFLFFQMRSCRCVQRAFVNIHPIWGIVSIFAGLFQNAVQSVSWIWTRTKELWKNWHEFYPSSLLLPKCLSLSILQGRAAAPLCKTNGYNPKNVFWRWFGKGTFSSSSWNQKGRPRGGESSQYYLLAANFRTFTETFMAFPQLWWWEHWVNLRFWGSKVSFHPENICHWWVLVTSRSCWSTYLHAPGACFSCRARRGLKFVWCHRVRCWKRSNGMRRNC